MKIQNEDRHKRQKKEKYKPTGGGWSAMDKRLKVNQWLAGDPMPKIKKKQKKGDEA